MRYLFLTADRQLFYDLCTARLSSYGRAYLRAIENGTDHFCWVEKAGNLSAGVQVVKDALAKDVDRTDRIINYLVEFHELLTAVQLAYNAVPAALVPGGGVSIHNLTTGKQVMGGVPDSGTDFLHLTQAQGTGVLALLAAGAGSFANLSGHPRQNPALAAELDQYLPAPVPPGGTVRQIGSAALGPTGSRLYKYDFNYGMSWLEDFSNSEYSISDLTGTKRFSLPPSGQAVLWGQWLAGPDLNAAAYKTFADAEPTAIVRTDYLNQQLAGTGSLPAQSVATAGATLVSTGVPGSEVWSLPQMAAQANTMVDMSKQFQTRTMNAPLTLNTLTNAALGKLVRLELTSTDATDTLKIGNQLLNGTETAQFTTSLTVNGTAANWTVQYDGLFCPADTSSNVLNIVVIQVVGPATISVSIDPQL